MFAFILRPFGVKQDIDFERVDRELIRPALYTVGINGGTAAELLSEAVLSEDLVERLLSADLVVADLSVENASVFYQLGLSHALRNQRTLLIASNAHRAFELFAQRYCAYDANNPAAAVQLLAEMMRASFRSNATDSPVYALLPGLQPPKAPEVPEGFDAEVARAESARDLGHLRLLSHEARGFHWRLEALKRVGRTQLRHRDLDGARDTLEQALSAAPADLRANLLLGTVYQRQKDLRRSDEAFRRAVASLDADSPERAEAFAMLARNAKSHWLEAWQSHPGREERRVEALRSPQLKAAYDHYLQSFRHDLNQYWGGLSALGLGTIMLSLASELPDTWAELFEDETEADLRLAALERDVASLAAGVNFTLAAAADRARGRDIWLELARAELELLLSDRPGRVAGRYRQAMATGEPFVGDAALSQISIYEDLGVRADNARAAIEVLQPAQAQPETRMSAATRALLFVGHAIDDADRVSPRFPRSGESMAREAIRRVVEKEAGNDAKGLLGVAGASSGGDILFHEVCASLGIESLVCLAVPASDYERFGVIGAGAEWGARFREVIARHRSLVLSQSTELPRWLRSNAPYNFWGRDTAWRYHTATAIGPTTAIALWDGKPGATADLVGMARERGITVNVLDAAQLFGGGEETATS